MLRRCSVILTVAASLALSLSVWFLMQPAGTPGALGQTGPDTIEVGNTFPGATAELRLTIESLPRNLHEGHSIELYLEGDFQIPDAIDRADVYFDLSGGSTFPTYDSPAAAIVAAATSGNPVVACEFRTRGETMSAVAEWAHFPDELDGEALSAFHYVWLIPEEDDTISEVDSKLEADHTATGLISGVPPADTTVRFRLVPLYGSADAPGPGLTVPCMRLTDRSVFAQISPTEAIVISDNHQFGGDDRSIRVIVPDLYELRDGNRRARAGKTVTLVFTQAAGIRNPRTPGIYNAGYSNLRPDDPTNQGAQVALSPVYIETNDAPPVTNIVVCFGYDDREVNVSWDAVPDATYYRIGYVNMVKDYPRAKTSVTGEWLEAFIYVDVNALNIPVNDEGRANYTLRRLSSGDRHAFTVLTSNNVTVTRETFGGVYTWPQNPRWAFYVVDDPFVDCSSTR